MSHSCTNRHSLVAFLSVSEFVFFILGVVFGAITSFFLSNAAAMPHFQIRGLPSGQVSGGSFRVSTITMSSDPGFVDIYVGKKRKPGGRRFRRFGGRTGWTLFTLPFERLTALECRAAIGEEGSDERSALWWLRPNEQNAVANVISISPGKSGNLRIFAWEDAKPDKYFYYQPIDEETGSVSIPPESAKMTGNKTFVLTLTYLYRLQKHFKIEVLQEPGVSLQITLPDGGKSI
jgi:hypothetical protein